MKPRTLARLGALAALALVAGSAAAPDLTREQALASLTGSDPALRRAAVNRLADVGTMADVPRLVSVLRDPDAEARDDAQHALWEIWGRSGDREIDRIYQAGIDQMTAGRIEEAIATFTRVIELKPDFAEGWNKRATLYFLAGDLAKSLADCGEVMKRNPYHFGALAGYAQIYIRLGQYERALDYARRALAINPNLDGMRRDVEVLEHLIAQRHQRMI
jgi:tetratricopeptide (TPR) repeat protein